MGWCLSEAEATLKALMLRGLDGDAAAHAQLLSAMGRYLRGYFARRLGAGAADVEDLVQETLLAIHAKRATYDRGQPFTAWAYTIARYKLIDAFRRQKLRKTEPLEAADQIFAAESVDEGEARLDLADLLSSLPARQRAVLEDVKLLGLSTEEAAAKAGMSGSAVKVSVHRSIKALAKRVRDEN
jgi:RNA polymerase sigma-70 factor (ECF subfamily)